MFGYTQILECRVRVCRVLKKVGFGRVISGSGISGLITNSNLQSASSQKMTTMSCYLYDRPLNRNPLCETNGPTSTLTTTSDSILKILFPIDSIQSTVGESFREGCYSRNFPWFSMKFLEKFKTAKSHQKCSGNNWICIIRMHFVHFRFIIAFPVV